MKQIDDSIHWQNAQLYAYGVAFNCLRLTLDDLFMGFAAPSRAETDRLELWKHAGPEVSEQGS
jgi:hypothetical protein